LPKMSQNRYQDPPPYGLHPTFQTLKPEEREALILRNESSFLPQMNNKKNYYLAHSLDLSCPAFVNVRIIDHKGEDDIFFDNKRDQKKIQNRSLSPDDLKENDVHKSYKAEPHLRRNTHLSKEMPFNKENMAKSPSNYREALPVLKSTSSQPYLDSTTLTELNSSCRPSQIKEVLQPLRKDQSFLKKPFGKLEREIQKQVQLSRASGINLLKLGRKVKLARNSNPNNRY